MNTVQLLCSNCNSLFLRNAAEQRHRISIGKGQQNFCSRNCKNQSLVKPLPLSITDEYLSGLNCREIGANHGVSWGTVRKHLINKGIALRNRSEQMNIEGRNPTKGKGHTLATKAKLRAANEKQFSITGARQVASHNQIQAMATGKIAKVSKIEGIVANELDALGVTYQQQQGIRDTTTGRFFACVDFLLENKVVIEVNGTYWHSDPRFYPNGPIHPSQKQTTAKYEEKIKHLKAMGYRIIEIWEHDLRLNPRQAVADALA